MEKQRNLILKNDKPQPEPDQNTPPVSKYYIIVQLETQNDSESEPVLTLNFTKRNSS
jgi:hypothetical protein